MKEITVAPAAGRVVPDPAAGDKLPAEGRRVPHNAYWQRRLQDGDVVLQVPAAPTKTAKGGE